MSWVRKLQNFEKEKLQLTVILHVERRRLSQMEGCDENPGCSHSEGPCQSVPKIVPATRDEDVFAASIQACFFFFWEGEGSYLEIVNGLDCLYTANTDLLKGTPKP